MDACLVSSIETPEEKKSYETEDIIVKTLSKM